MPNTKEQLRLATLTERDMVRKSHPTTGKFSLSSNSVDKTPLMLYTEGVTGERIETLLLKQMSTRRLADWISHEIKRPITGATITNWRKMFKIKRIKKV